MRVNTIELIKRLNLSEYRDFVRFGIGLSSFLSDEHIVIRKVSGAQEKPGRIVEGMSKKGKCEYYVDEVDRKGLTYRDDYGKIYSIIDNWHVPEDWIIISVLASQRRISRELIENDELNLKNHGGIVKGGVNYGFILGAGINSGLGPKNWKELSSDIERIISSGTTITKYGKKALKASSNINYLMPQVAKDISSDLYFDTIISSIYGEVKWNDLDSKSNKSFMDHNLFQVARIIAAQALRGYEQQVLTFNYDDLLETVLDRDFGIATRSEYSGVKSPGKKPINIGIIHSHGFLPHPTITGGTLSLKSSHLSLKQKNSLVLSTFEYMEKYLNANRYSYKQLVNQLNYTNLIIGNSIADYEEQKVLYDYHRKHLNQYSYLLTKETGDRWVDIYMAKFLLNLGVIVLYFHDWKDVNNYLKRI